MKGPNYGNKKNPKESRTIPVKGNRIRGDGEDYKVLWKCWYCGFINNEGQQTLGGSSSRSGLVHQVAPIPSAITDGTIAINRGIIAKHVLSKLDSSGNPVTITRHYKAVSGIGCPSCGSLNWKGLY